MTYLLCSLYLSHFTTAPMALWILKRLSSPVLISPLLLWSRRPRNSENIGLTSIFLSMRKPSVDWPWISYELTMWSKLSKNHSTFMKISYLIYSSYFESKKIAHQVLWRNRAMSWHFCILRKYNTLINSKYSGFLCTNTRKSGIFDLSFNEQKKSTIFIEPSVSFHVYNTILIKMQILTPELSEMICVVNLVLALFQTSESKTRCLTNYLLNLSPAIGRKL